MKEIFLSHSSAQKDFALALRDEIGHDRCIIDCADFEPGKKSEDEIVRWVNGCEIFVVLLSKTALASCWINKELDLASKRFYSYDRKNFVFLPLIIDDTIDHTDTKIPEWIRKEECFTLKLFQSPVIAYHCVIKAHRDLIWLKNPRIRRKDTLFVGRKEELNRFEVEANNHTNAHHNGAVISGRRHVGKKSFARQCVISELKESESFEPYKITLREKENIEDFILQLNDFARLSEEEIKRTLSGSVKYKEAKAVELANIIFSHKGYIFIIDKMSCVGYDGKLTEWFKAFITHPDLAKELRVFVLSEIQWLVNEHKNYPQLINLNLKPLTMTERLILVNKCVEQLELTSLIQSDAELIAKELNHSPNDIIKFLEAVKERPTRRDSILNNLKNEADASIRAIIGNYLEHDLSLHMLLVLSKFEFLSIRLLERIFAESKQKMTVYLYEMTDFNLIEEFGDMEAYLRLDAAIVDYMRRSRFVLPQSIRERIEDIVEPYLESGCLIDDMSSFLIQQKQNLIDDYARNKSLEILIPSVAIRYVIDLYYAEKYEAVIKLCKRILDDARHTYPQFNREIKYWMALSYAHKRNSLTEIVEIVSSLSMADKDFILGFYHRRWGDYEKAAEYLEDARYCNPSSNKVARELVEVYLRLKRTDEALELADANYHRRPENVYHIQALFNCLNAKAKRTPDEVNLQRRLLAEMENSNAKQAKSMYASMAKSFRDS